MTAAETTFDPLTMDPATVVRLQAVPVPGDEEIHEIRLPYWRVGALMAICNSRPSVPRAWDMKGFMRAPRSPHAPAEAGCLLNAARWVSEVAQRCRHARWYSLPPERIPTTAFDADIDAGYRCSFTEALIEAQEALTTHELAVWRSTAGPAVGEKVRGFLDSLLVHPNIPPAIEAGLAARGYTAAEHLIDGAAVVIIDLARMYGAATGDTRAAFHSAGKEAMALAWDARLTIEEGVRHTLKRERAAVQVV